MKVSEIQCCGNGNKRFKGKKNNVSFQATPEQIIDAAAKSSICCRKKNLLYNIADIFQDLRKNAKCSKEPVIEYKLGEVNNAPKNMNFIGKHFWKQLDKKFNNGHFSCSESSVPCNCGNDMKLGEYVKTLLTLIKAENPDKISIEVPEKKRFLFF
jgi:hypothetical protein